MADYNRSRQEYWRQQRGWDDPWGHQSNNEDEPNYTNTENRGYRDRSRYSGNRDEGWQSRYERQMNTEREGDFDNSWQRSGRHGDSGYRSDYNYGGGQRGFSSGYSDFGGDYSSSGGSRNLYDRGYQGMNRRDYENRENRLGGANYDRYGDAGRYEEYGSYRGSRSGYPNENYGRWSDRGRSYRHNEFGRGDDNERSWWDRASDEVSSWFGDEEAEHRRDRDRQLARYRGMGPKNYTRSDERILEDINDRLSDDPFVDASDIEVSVNQGEVTLSGHVDHRSSKRRAEDIAESVSGVRHVENRLRVGQSTTMASEGTSAVPGSNRERNETTS
jgi:osmotically-inducible protein OsmY